MAPETMALAEAHGVRVLRLSRQDSPARRLV